MTGETRLLRAIRAVVAELVAPHAFHVPARYRVVQNTAGRLTLQAFKAGPWPDTLPISLMCGSPGAAGEPALGSTVLVQFIEGDPSLPVVTHFERPEGAYFVPISSKLDASGTVKIGPSATLVELAGGSAKVGRVGDTTHAGTIVLAHTPAGSFVSGAYFPGTGAGDTAAAAAAAAITGSGNVPTLLAMTDGRITSGASKVKA